MTALEVEQPPTMRLGVWKSVAVLPSIAYALGDAQIYLQPPPSQAKVSGIPHLSPYEANAVLANFVGLGKSIFGNEMEEIIGDVRKEWEYLWNSVHPIKRTIGSGSSSTVMLLVHSSYPEGGVHQ